MTDQGIEEILKRDRSIVILGLIGVIILAWVYTIYLTRAMGESQVALEMISPHAQSWTITDFLLNFLMWTIMQIAMMTPTAAPMLLFYTKVNRQRFPEERPYIKTGIFLLGYLIVWTGFSLVATTAQWGLHSMTLLSTGMGHVTPVAAGVLLIAAGAFQFSPVKDACLSHCRTPVGFIMTEWQDGKIGALRMGIKHGSFCVGCCWLLMLLLFAVGVMNLLWMAVLTIFVLVEKLAPGGDRIGKAAGVVFLLLGGLDDICWIGSVYGDALSKFINQHIPTLNFYGLFATQA